MSVPTRDPEIAALKLFEYCQTNDWSGYDPYDALNSPFVRTLPIINSRVPRIVLTQFLKRSPVNVRRLLGIPRTQNPKALALFLNSFLRLSRLDLLAGNQLSELMIERLVALRSPGSKYWCWGYSFPWQTRTIVVPCFAPSLVCTTFVADALLNLYEVSNEARLLEMAASAGQYIIDELYYTEGDHIASFSYPLPDLKTKVHNASLLAAALLVRLFSHTGKEEFLAIALKATRYSVSKQREDGSWPYGELPTQQWVDNFHTGYNLSALRSIQLYARTNEFDQSIASGFSFYKEHFIREDGAARYFHDRTYPIDVHCVAQTLLTLLEFHDQYPSNLKLVESVFAWTMDHMWDERGFFYYRVLRTLTIRTPYMRWSEAWMLLALCTLAEQRREARQTNPELVTATT
jgi:rhamnogalacturonyl hydrolase YesR